MSDNNVGQNNLAGVDILIFRPQSEYKYSFSINGVANQRLINRLDINTLIPDFHRIHREVQELSCRFKSFVIVVDPLELIELATNEDPDDFMKSYKALRDEELTKALPELKGAKTPTLWEKTQGLHLGVFKQHETRFKDLFSRLT